MGDLAVIVGAEVGIAQLSLGRIVRVLEAGSDWSHIEDDRHHWLVLSQSGPVLCSNGKGGRWGPEMEFEMADDDMRPIRDSDGTDETLSWKELPSPVEIIKEQSHAK